MTRDSTAELKSQDELLKEALAKVEVPRDTMAELVSEWQSAYWKLNLEFS